MTEKVGFIKNPLTIIAIFAGIAEVSGTIVLPFVHQDNQLVFIYFLMAFPFLLVIIFFLTLNFNNKVLYAPSDYQNEENYIKVFRYDQSRLEKVEVKVNKDNSTSILVEEFAKLSESINHRFINLESSRSEVSDSMVSGIATPDEETHHVANFPKVNQFIQRMDQLGYTFKVYGIFSIDEPTDRIDKPQLSKAIWLGRNIHFQTATIVIKEAKKFYPHLCYIHISGDLNDESPYEIHNLFFIGGATESAEDLFRLKPLTNIQFDSIINSNSKEEMYSIIRQGYPSDIIFTSDSQQ